MRAVISQARGRNGDALRQAILSVGLECEAQDCVTHAQLPVRLTQGPVDLVLVVMGAHEETDLAALQHAATYLDLTVLAVGSTFDAQLILKAHRAGAKLFLDESKLREELQNALLKLTQGGALFDKHGKLILVSAVLPGIGVSTVASNIAFSLGDQHPGHVALAELGAGVPALALSLALTPRFSLTELFNQYKRLDATMMRHALVEHPNGVSVLAHPPETLTAPAPDKAAVRTTLLLLKSMFDYVVVDLGHVLEPGAMEAMQLAEKVVIVTRFDVPALRLTRQYLQQLVSRGLARDKLHLVANRYGQARQVDWKQAEQALSLPIQEYIPDDVVTMNKSVNTGVPLVQTARRATITKQFGKLAHSLNGRLGI